MDSGRSEVCVVPVTIEEWDRLAWLFSGSPGMDACFCMWPRRRPGTHVPDHARNREDLKSLIRAGKQVGLLAKEKERAVGWCACGPRHTYPQYRDEDGAAAFWAIPCLYIDPTADRRIVAAALIEAASDLALANGAIAIEGPPPWWLPGDADAISRATDTFLENEFTRIGPGARVPELRRILA